jgi:hypothetical protein
MFMTQDEAGSTTLPNFGSKLCTTEQVLTFGPKRLPDREVERGRVERNRTITAFVRWDDTCRNGHNTFGVTGEVRRGPNFDMGGCIHAEVASHFPELAGVIKYHLMSAEGPLHYKANTLFWLGYNGNAHPSKHGPNPPHLEYARSTAVWPDMPESFLFTADHRRDTKGTPPDWWTGTDTVRAVEKAKAAAEAKRVVVEQALDARLPTLMAEFRQAVEQLGFTW